MLMDIGLSWSQLPIKVCSQPIAEVVEVFKLDQAANVIGTHGLGTIGIAPAALVTKFGPPAECDRYKVSGRYIFFDSSGNIFTVYDWKSTFLFDDTTDEGGEPMYCSPEEFWSLEYSYSFSIGGRDEAGLAGFIDWLTGEVA